MARGDFDARDLAAIRWADLVTGNEAHADPTAWSDLRERFTHDQAVELTLAICLFNFLNRFNDTMWLQLDDGAPPGARLEVEPKSFQAYAASMYPNGGA